MCHAKSFKVKKPCKLIVCEIKINQYVTFEISNISTLKYSKYYL